MPTGWKTKNRGKLTDAPYTARQLAELAVSEALWAIDWQLRYPGDVEPMDWRVPAGAWRHGPMTPIEAVMAIAQACGGVAVPARAARSITIRYAHPTPRWNWPATTPDATLAPSRLYRVAGGFDPAEEYDKVYVFGEAGGVAAGVKRAGFAGNKPAPTIIDPLVTHADCARERGRQILSGSGNRLDVTVEAPFHDTAQGLTPIWPGLLVEVQETPPWRGLSTAISITLDRQAEGAPLTATQTITLERAE
ncbi:MAG: hypothetical protein Q8O34_00875 [Rhodocyclaceae bacterium]|nr:hypothetical protein [Rhodocyclaceae bacterium]